MIETSGMIEIAARVPGSGKIGAAAATSIARVRPAVVSQVAATVAADSPARGPNTRPRIVARGPQVLVRIARRPAHDPSTGPWIVARAAAEGVPIAARAATIAALRKPA
jgi:hypothetical protein